VPLEGTPQGSHKSASDAMPLFEGFAMSQSSAQRTPAEERHPQPYEPSQIGLGFQAIRQRRINYKYNSSILIRS
jgi:hypothetical protein